MRRFIIVAFFIILILLGLAELVLSHFDPLGVWALQHNLYAIWQYGESHSSGYILKTRTYQTSFDMHMDNYGTRYTPASNPLARCVIVTIGDSITSGWGLDDTETWVNHVAALVPDVRWVNAARGRYNTHNAAQLIPAYPADGYVYLQFTGDDNGGFQSLPHVAPPTLAIAAYSQAWYERAVPSQPVVDRDTYWRAIEQMQSANVLWFGFDFDPLAATAQSHGMIVLSLEWQNQSWADHHPDAATHTRIATAMLPAIEGFVSQVCEAD